MIRRHLLSSVASLLVITTTTTMARAQIVASPSLLRPTATQPAAAAAPTPPDQAAAPASAPANQAKRSRSGIPPETLAWLLNQRLQQASSAEATVSPTGLEPDQPARLREALGEYQNAKMSGTAAEIAQKLTRIQADVAQSKDDVAALRACREHYSKAKTILDRNPEMATGTVRQDVGKKILELQKLIAPLHNAVALVDGTLTRERYNRQADATFQEQKAVGPAWRDPSGYYSRDGYVYDTPGQYDPNYHYYYTIDPLGRPYLIRR